MLKLDRGRAIAVLTFLGWALAKQWDNAKLASTLQKSKDVYEPDTQPDDEEVAKDLLEVLAAIESGQPIEVDGGDDAESPAAEDGSSQGAEEGSAEEAPKKGRKGKKAKGEAQPDDSVASQGGDKKTKKAKRGRVRAAESRGYCAGKVIAGLGLSDEELTQKNCINDSTIAAVDKMYKKENPKVSAGALKWAFDAIRGYKGLSAETGDSEETGSEGSEG